MGVEVAPVDDVQARQPGHRFEHLDGVAAAEDHDRVGRQREREVGDLVLDDVGAGDSRRRGGELIGADGKLGIAARRPERKRT